MPHSLIGLLIRRTTCCTLWPSAALSTGLVSRNTHKPPKREILAVLLHGRILNQTNCFNKLSSQFAGKFSKLRMKLFSCFFKTFSRKMNPEEVLIILCVIKKVYKKICCIIFSMHNIWKCKANKKKKKKIQRDSLLFIIYIIITPQLFQL